MTAPSVTRITTPAMTDTRAEALIEGVVSAVRGGQDQRVRELITALATAAADPADLWTPPTPGRRSVDRAPRTVRSVRGHPYPALPVTFDRRAGRVAKVRPG
ncbi:hypothetical protein [Streptomyces sp. NPDC031705]|uniref:hypothetical protein n=1 Tax=Streptomyces sp. NPDC031705 TaxID=3155729 RepID=UPI0033F2E2A9